MDEQDFADSTSPAAVNSTGEWVAECLSALMARCGVPVRQQAAQVAMLCDLSISQARRKLKGASWTIDEVMALCRHYQVGLDAVFADPVFLPASVAAPGASGQASSGVASYPATLYVDELMLDCDVRIGAQQDAAGGTSLLATLHPIKGWMVGSPGRLARESAHSPRYSVEQLQLRPADTPPLARIAVLDDDRHAADALVDWFQEMGFEAHSFQSAEALLAQRCPSFDAYVVDLILGGGRTSQGVVQRIRAEQPEAPIILLTGQLRDGTATEATLATILRTQGVTFFEKPVRPAVLTAAIQSSLDRVAQRHV